MQPFTAARYSCAAWSWEAASARIPAFAVVRAWLSAQTPAAVVVAGAVGEEPLELGRELVSAR